MPEISLPTLAAHLDALLKHADTPDYSAALLSSCASLLPPDASESMKAAVAEWDASGPAPAVPFQVDVKPDDIRALRRIEARQSRKPTGQVRKAIREWIKRQEG